jgi:hypothetical protein
MKIGCRIHLDQVGLARPLQTWISRSRNYTISLMVLAILDYLRCTRLVIRVKSTALGLSLRHIFAVLRLPIVAIAGAVVDLG